MEAFLNVVAFNIPWPPNYGGVIDVFYKIKALKQCGVRLILHCFEYDRPHAAELEEMCEKVYYYKRHTGLLRNCSLLPYNVYSRKTPELLENLSANEYPILFEGLHSCYYIDHPRLKHRKKIFRAANIEHEYYRHLAGAEKNIIKKLFFFIESLRFKYYQQTVEKADLMLAVSATDTAYLRRIFPEKQIAFMPCFHANDTVRIEPGMSDFILYHGKLSVVENSKAALFLIKEVFGKLSCRCVIAGMNPPESLIKAAQTCPNIRIEANPSEERMQALIRQAQIHLLITFQATGLKLKLLNSLFAGRHTIVNSRMAEGSGLESLCHIGNTPAELIELCQKWIHIPMDDARIEERKKMLFPTFSNRLQGERLYKMIYHENNL